MKREHREFRDGDIEEEIREAFQVVFQSSLSKFFQSSLCKVSNHPCPFYPTYNISISVADGGGHSLTGSDRDCTNIKNYICALCNNDDGDFAMIGL